MLIRLVQSVVTQYNFLNAVTILHTDKVLKKESPACVMYLYFTTDNSCKYDTLWLLLSSSHIDLTPDIVTRNKIVLLCLMPPNDQGPVL